MKVSMLTGVLQSFDPSVGRVRIVLDKPGPDLAEFEVHTTSLFGFTSGHRPTQGDRVEVFVSSPTPSWDDILGVRLALP